MRGTANIAFETNYHRLEASFPSVVRGLLTFLLVEQFLWNVSDGRATRRLNGILDSRSRERGGGERVEKGEEGLEAKQLMQMRG